jgi:hypothetical protein
MKKYLFIPISIILLSACSHKVENSTNVYAIEKPIKIEEKEAFFNLKKQSPDTKEIPKNIHLDEQEFVNKIAQANTNIDWFARGPLNVGGRTRALALDIDDSNRILVGGVSGGIWYSDDLGASFNKATTPQQFHSITCIAQDQSMGNHATWYYGTGEQNGNSADLLGNGIYKSTDNGLTWSILESTTNEVSQTVSTLGDFRYVKDIKVNPINGDIVAASFAGIFISQDGGATWTNTLVGGVDPNGFGYLNFGKQTNIDVTSQGVFYATLSSDCVNKGIWRSVGGITWTDITPTGFATAYRRIESGISPSEENQVFFIADASTTLPLADDHQLWKYNANTNSWTDKTTNIPFGACPGFFDFDFGYFQSQNSYDLFITVHPADTNLVFLGGTNLYRSTDGFSSPAHAWIGGYFCDTINPGNYIYPNHHPDNHGAVFIPNSDKMISAHDGGLSITENCKATEVTWESLNNGYNTSQFYTIAMEPGETENEVIMGGLQDNGTFYTNTINPNQEWMWTFYGDGAYCAITPDRENYYISWQGGKTFKSTIDVNGNVTNIARIDPSGVTDPYTFINPFILDPTNNNTMYLAGGPDIWRNDSLNHIPLNMEPFQTNDMGWNKIVASGTGGFFSTPRISTLDMSESNADILYYGTNTGQLLRLSGLDANNYVKTNIKENIMPTGAYVSCVEADNKNANHVMVTFSNYEVNSVFYSQDAGDNWEDVSGNLEEFENGSGAGPSVNWIHIHNNENVKTYLAGTTSGLFSTQTLNGTNTIWAREGLNEIGNVPINMITSREYDNNIVVATHGNGVFSNKQFVSGVKDLSENTAGYYLSNIHPNPVTEKMKFSYRINKDAAVKIYIYDNNGREIEELENSQKSKGTYEKRWFVPSNTAKGMYYLVMDVNGNRNSKQFIVQ